MFTDNESSHDELPKPISRQSGVLKAAKSTKTWSGETILVLLIHKMFSTDKESSCNVLPKPRSQENERSGVLKAVKGLKSQSGENNLSLYYYSVLPCKYIIC